MEQLLSDGKVKLRIEHWKCKSRYSDTSSEVLKFTIQLSSIIIGSRTLVATGTPFSFAGIQFGIF